MCPKQTKYFSEKYGLDNLINLEMAFDVLPPFQGFYFQNSKVATLPPVSWVECIMWLL
jgi:hypothetical protein